VHKLGLADRVEFHGVAPRQLFLKSLVNADAFLCPSMHDSASWVVGEAIAAKVPVIALDVGGPRTLIEMTCGGAKIPLRRDAPALLAEALHAAVGAVSTDPVDLTRLPATIISWYTAAVLSSPKGA
jgi:glycosyltransferase involved in cell wall biosynthesis